MAGTVGTSGITPIKQNQLREILETHLAITKSILAKDSISGYFQDYYLYIDAYCGPGIVDGEKGSPIIFLEAAKEIGIKYEAIFIDKNMDNCEQLTNAVDPYIQSGSSIKIFHSNNVDVLDVIANDPPSKKVYGLLYLDPNGLPSFKSAKDIYLESKYDKLDLLINCPSTAVKRTCNNNSCENDKRVIDHLLEINKRYWIVRNPLGRWQWSFILGSNWQYFQEFNHLDFHRASSPDGREILDKITYTQYERDHFRLHGYYYDYPGFMKHPFTQLVKREVFSNARMPVNYWKPTCQKCKSSRASHCHHLVYPKWNAKSNVREGFDVPENLIAVCHECHCIIHGKDK